MQSLETLRPNPGNNPLAALELLGSVSKLDSIRTETALSQGLKLESETRLGFSASRLRLGLVDQADRFQFRGTYERRQDPASFGFGAHTGLPQKGTNTYKLGFAGRVPTGVLSYSTESDDVRGLRQSFYGYTAGLPSFAGGGRLHLLAGSRETRQLAPTSLLPTTLSFTDTGGHTGNLNFGDVKSTRVGALWAPGFLGGRTSLLATLDTVISSRVQGTEGRSDVYSRGGKAVQLGLSRDLQGGGNVYLGGMAGLTAGGSMASRLMNLGFSVGRGFDVGPARLQRFELSVGQSGRVKFEDLAGGTYVEHTRPDRTAFSLGLGGTLGGGDASLQLGNRGLFFSFGASFDANMRIARRPANGNGFALASYRFFGGGTLPSLSAPAEQARKEQLERQLEDILARKKTAEERLAEARERLEELRARGVQVASADMAAAREAVMIAQAETVELVAQAETIAAEVAGATAASTGTALETTSVFGGFGAEAAVAAAAAAGVAGSVTNKEEKKQTTTAADTTAPTTTAGPSVSGTTATATTLSATLDEAGTGYYLIQAAAAAAPSVATLLATGTTLAMTANTAATANFSGLTAATAYKIYFVAKDTAGNAQAAVQSVAVTTAAANGAPSFSTAPSNQSTGKNTSAAQGIVVADAETAAASLTVTGTSSNTTLVPNANIVVTAGAGGNRTVTVTPAAGQTGTATITLTVSDGSLTTNATYTVTVTNAAPTLAAQSALVLAKNVAMSTTLSAGSDTDTGETLTYSIVSALPAGLSFTAGTRVLSGTPTANQAATPVTYRVTDASGAYAERTFNITVQNNTAPSINTGTLYGPENGGTLTSNFIYGGSHFEFSDAEGGSMTVTLTSSNGGKMWFTDSSGNDIANATTSATRATTATATITATAGATTRVYYGYQAPPNVPALVGGGTTYEVITGSVQDSGGLSDGTPVGSPQFQ